MRILRIVLQIFTFIFVFVYPSKMDNQVNIFLSKKVSIKINKNHPSYVAYDALNIKKTVQGILPAEASNENLRVIKLSTESQNEVMNHFHPLSKKLVLNTIVIKKELQVFNTQAVNENYIRNTSLEQIEQIQYQPPTYNQNNWVAEFKPYFRKQVQDGFANVNWDRAGQTRGLAEVSGAKSGTSVKETFVTFGSKNNFTSSAPLQNQQPLTAERTDKSKFAESQTKLPHLGSSANRIIGIVQLGELPFTNDHHIEIRRFEEGVFREKGTADIQQSTYEIFPSDLKGFLLGRLVDKSGKILGEGVVRISDTVLSKTGAHRGPMILIKPTSDIRGQVVSAYDVENKKGLNQGSKATIFQGQNEKPIGRDGQVRFDNVVRNSSTAVVMESKGHFTSQQIIVAGENFSTELIPEKMGTALKQIVSDLKQQNLNDPNMAIVMGKVTFDGRPVSGVSVKIENVGDTEAVYFNSLMLPELKLSETSENGYFAFIVEASDMLTLMAYRGDKYFGHINTVVGPGMSSFSEIKNTIKTESVEIKVYDPFTGLPEFASLELQGLAEPIEASEGFGSAQLPSLGRWSFLFSTPSQKYLSAHYTYIEKSDYIYVPVISREWMNFVFSSTKTSLLPKTNLVVGFVVDEDFEVEVPGMDLPRNHILYFDYTGKIVDRGTQGGGFIIYNLPEGLYEPLVFGSQSQKVYSRVAPLKSSDIFVFTYKLDGSI